MVSSSTCFRPLVSHTIVRTIEQRRNWFHLKKPASSDTSCKLISKYQSLVASAVLKADSRQFQLAQELSALLCQCQQHTDPPRGIYIHGTVGTGKSMLFDLFFESAKEDLADAAARFHFHEFMLMIHKNIHNLKQCSSSAEGAVSIVGRQLVEKGGLRLLCLDEFQVCFKRLVSPPDCVNGYTCALSS
jgi:protein AFG1